MRSGPLLVIIPDRLSDIVRKGEFAPRYYNPGNLFSDVHVVATNDDVPDVRALQHTAGRARLVVANIPFGQTRTERWLRWSAPVLDRWASRVVDLARQVRPAMVRCYGLDVNAYAALRIKETLGVPYVASVHTARDESPEPRSAPQQIMDRLWQRVERRIVAGAERVLPVYRAIVPQLLRLGAPRVEVAYNVLNPEHLGRKTDYRLHAPVRVLTVGRQLAHKRPDALLRAVARLPHCHLTVVGDGPAHAELRLLAASLGLGGRVTFTASIGNDELCASLPEFDIFAGHSDYCEIPKAVLEPLLTGLPVIMNRRAGAPVPEYSEDFMMLVDNDERGYYTALTALIEDCARREALGQRAYAHAQAHWGPAAAEAHIVRVYREIIGGTA